MKISLVTPTGGRPEAFKLCEYWISQQTVQPDEWIVVDDYPISTNTNMNQKVIRREPFWKNQEMTLPINLAEGIMASSGDVIFVIEDDDWYSPNYIESMMNKIQNFDLIGEGLTKYYNIRNKFYYTHNNLDHAGLFQTAFKKEVSKELIKLVLSNKNEKYIDILIWKFVHNKKMFVSKSPLSVGIKGLPGRMGIGYFHTEASCKNLICAKNLGLGKKDLSPFETLKNWIGEESAKKYYSL
jgi:glycosyltransferase involved in cell wall biosynthesis